MAGLLLLAAAVLLVTALVTVVRLLTQNLKLPHGWKALLQAVLVICALSLLIADELVGKRQFEKLCAANGVESIDLSGFKGRRVRVNYGTRTPIESLLPIQRAEVTFRDASTGEILFRYSNYYSTGGWLMRNTPISMGSSGPMLFRANGCGLALQDRLFKANQISIVN